MQKYRNFYEMGKAPWFSVLVQPKYLAYFSDPASSFCVADALFREFWDVVQGIEMANNALKLEAEHPEGSEFIRRDAQRACRTEAAQAACCHVLSTVPAGTPFFEHLWRGVRAEGGIYLASLQHLSAAELAMCAIYPFFSRMGLPPLAEAFCKDGTVGRYLLAIYGRLIENPE